MTGGSRTLLVVAAGVVSIAGARAAREVALDARGDAAAVRAPYAPSPASVRLLSLGYRELAADLLFIRLRVYFGGFYDTIADRVATLSEAVAALDPKFKRVYSYGANAMTIAPIGVDQSIYRRAIALLEQGIREFPQDWQMPLLAGQMYVQDLETDDDVQRRAWDDRGALLVEAAVRKPGAPQTSATWAATLRSRLGQRDRAVAGLRELLLVTNDKRSREALVGALAKLESADAGEIAAEIHEERARFEAAWHAARPALKPTWYILLGPPLPARFDLAELATGGMDVVGSEGIERLEPLYEDDPR